MARKRIEDDFAKFYEWCISDEKLSENTSKIYCSCARSLARSLEDSGKDVDSYLEEVRSTDKRKYSILATSWKSYQKYLGRHSVTSSVPATLPEEVVLAKLIIEKYNATAEHKVEIHA